MKINPVVKSLIYVFFAYAFLFVLSYSTFLQIPVFDGQVLVWQSLVEQSITWMPILISYIYLYLSIKREKKARESVFSESRLQVISIISIFLIGLSIGVHFSSQIIEDVLINQQELFSYKLAYFLDEQIGHLFILPGIAISLVLSALEVNRNKPKLAKADVWITNTLALLTALATSIMSVEAGLIYAISIPLILLGYYKFAKQARKSKINLMDYPFTRYFIVVTVITTAFSICWWIVNGFVQPEELGLQLIS